MSSAHERAYGWYDRGGILPSGLSVAPRRTAAEWDAGKRDERERIVRRLDAVVADNVVPEAIYDLLRELGWPLR